MPFRYIRGFEPSVPHEAPRAPRAEKAQAWQEQQSALGRA